MRSDLVSSPAYPRDAFVAKMQGDKAMPSDLLESLLQTGLSRLELERIAPMDEAAHLSGLSEDSLRRNHRDKIIVLGPRRLGMRVKHCLMLANQG
jgi:hypothetical protein